MVIRLTELREQLVGNNFFPVLGVNRGVVSNNITIILAITSKPYVAVILMSCDIQWNSITLVSQLEAWISSKCGSSNFQSCCMKRWYHSYPRTLSLHMYSELITAVTSMALIIFKWLISWERFVLLLRTLLSLEIAVLCVFSFLLQVESLLWLYVGPGDNGVFSRWTRLFWRRQMSCSVMICWLCLEIMEWHLQVIMVEIVTMRLMLDCW